MKLSELVEQATLSLKEQGDMDLEVDIAGIGYIDVSETLVIVEACNNKSYRSFVIKGVYK